MTRGSYQPALHSQKAIVLQVGRRGMFFFQQDYMVIRAAL